MFRSLLLYQFCLAICFHLVSSLSRTSSISIWKSFMVVARVGLSRLWSSDNCLVFLELFNSITKFPLAPLGKGLLAVEESSLYSKHGITSQHVTIPRGLAIFKFKSTMIGMLLCRVVIVTYLDRTMVRGSGSKSNHRNLLETCTPFWVRHCSIQPLFYERIIMPSAVPCKLGPIVSQITKLALL